MTQKEEVAVSVVRASKESLVYHYILKKIPIWYVRLAYAILGGNATLKLFPARPVKSDDSAILYGLGLYIRKRVYIIGEPKSTEEVDKETSD